MLGHLDAAFDKAEADDAIVVLTGRDGVFCGGFNLKEMGNGPQDALVLTSLGSKLARRIMAFPRPVILLASGHTIAMGAFLSLACDYSVIAEGDFKVGLNETLIGMTMHNFGIEMGRYHLPKSYFNRCVINAEIFDPKGAMHAGFFDKVIPVEQLPMAPAMIGQMFGQLDNTAFKNTKRRSRKDIFAVLDQAIKDDLDPAKVHAM
jgi:enoyl-CoA hydratase